MGTLRELPQSEHAIRSLHAEIEKLASAASAAYVKRTPLRVGTSNEGKDLPIEIWYETDALTVLTCDGGVFLSGGSRFEYGPNWSSITNGEARALANALISAAAFVNADGACDDTQ